MFFSVENGWAGSPLLHQLRSTET